MVIEIVNKILKIILELGNSFPVKWIFLKNSNGDQSQMPSQKMLQNNFISSQRSFPLMLHCSHRHILMIDANP